MRVEVHQHQMRNTLRLLCTNTSRHFAQVIYTGNGRLPFRVSECSRQFFPNKQLVLLINTAGINRHATSTRNGELHILRLLKWNFSSSSQHGNKPIHVNHP